MNILFKVLKFVFYYFPLGLLSAAFEEKDEKKDAFEPDIKVRGVRYDGDEFAGYTNSKHNELL